MNLIKGKASDHVNNTVNNDPKSENTNLVKITGALAIVAVFMGYGIQSVNGQTLVTKKQYEKILTEARNSQELIWEDMAAFIYEWGIEKFLQQEIEKQTSKLGNSTDEFNLFDDEAIKNRDRDTILSKEAMEKNLRYIVDSISAQDAVRYYEAFHNYQESGKNIVGKKKGKGTYIQPGWNIGAFPTKLNLNTFENNKNIPYTKKEQEVKKTDFENVYEVELSKRKSEAEKNRKQLAPSAFAQADLVALDKARQNIANKIWKQEVQPIVERIFKEYYNKAEDGKGKKGK